MPNDMSPRELGGLGLNSFMHKYYEELAKELPVDEVTLTSKIATTKVEPRGKKSLSEFTKKVCDEGALANWKEKFSKELKHVRDDANVTTTLWIKETNFRTKIQELVAYVAIEDKNDGRKCIQALEVLPEYQSYELGGQILKYAMKNGANLLYVNPNNKVAIALYTRNGWKFGKDDGKKLRPMYLGKDEKLDESIAQCTTLSDALDNIFSHNELVALWQEQKGDDGSYHSLVWKGEAWKIPEEYAGLSINRIFGTIPEKITDADYINIEVGGVANLEEGASSAPHEDSATYMFELADNETRLQFTDIIDESADTKLYPVYIMLMHSGTVLANVIKKVTNSNFSHSSISFDASMTDMYSFGRKADSNPFIGSFKGESIQDPFFKEKSIPYVLYIVPCTKPEITAMKKRLDFFIKNATKFKYDFTGLFKNYLGVADNPEYKYFCSRFVADIINAGRPSVNPYVIEPSLMKPEDFTSTTFAQYVGGGVLSSYDPVATRKTVRRILNDEEMRRAAIDSGTGAVTMSESVVLNEFIQTNTIDSREARDAALKKYGMRRAGYGQRTDEDDKEYAKRSDAWEKKVPKKQRKKIYQEDGDGVGSEEFVDPDHALRTDESAIYDDKREGNLLVNWYDGWTINTISDDADQCRVEWEEQPDAPWLGTVSNVADDNKVAVSESTARVLVDPTNQKMVDLYTSRGFQFVDGAQARGKAQPMYKVTGKPGEIRPVYVVLFYSGTKLGKLIKAAAGPHFSHAAISFTPDLSTMYSFGAKTGLKIDGFVEDSISAETYQTPDTQYAIYMVPATNGQYDKMQERIEWFTANKSKFRYDFVGLFKIFLGISDNPKYRYFCSRFVADILNSGDPEQPYFADPSLVTPENYVNTTFAQYVSGGKVSDFDAAEVTRIAKVLIQREAKKRAALPISENAVLPFVKSFRIRLDKDGNVTITQKEYNDFDRHVNNSLRLLKSYRDSDNFGGMKNELCRLYYMVELIDKYYSKNTKKNPEYAKKMIDIRSVMLNALTNYLKLLGKKDPEFDFTAYYGKSKYGTDIKISPKGVLAMGKVVSTLL